MLKCFVKATIVLRLCGLHYTTKLLLKMVINLWKMWVTS